MSFGTYAFLVVPALKALAKMPVHIKEAKADDGKISLAEFIEIWAKVGLDMAPTIPDIVRLDDDE